MGVVSRKTVTYRTWQVGFALDTMLLLKFKAVKITSQMSAWTVDVELFCMVCTAYNIKIGGCRDGAGSGMSE